MRLTSNIAIISALFLSPTVLLANHNEANTHSSERPRLTLSSQSSHTYSNESSSQSSASVTVTSSHSHSSSHHHSSHHHSVEEDLIYLFLEIFDEALFFGGIASMERVEGGDSFGLTPRVEGELLLPFFKFDASALSGMTQNEMGSDLSFEMGYGPWALHYRNTSFLTDSYYTPIQGYNQFDFLYRMSFGSEFEVDLGLGSYQIDDEMHFAFSLPMKIAFTPQNIIEFRPTWSQNVTDYDIALYSGTEFYSLKVGYRYIAQLDPYSATPINAVSTVYAGMSAHY